jgi:hypothetical protein
MDKDGREALKVTAAGVVPREQLKDSPTGQRRVR